MVSTNLMRIVTCLVCILGCPSLNIYAQLSPPADGAQGPPSSTNGQGQGQPSAPSPDDQEISKAKCLMPRPLIGDLEYLEPFFGSWMQNWSVGIAASVQAVKYTFGTKNASSNTSTGVGIAFRYYGDSPIGDRDEAIKRGFTDEDLEGPKKLDGIEKDKRGRYTLPIYRINPTCRATTADFGLERKKKLAASIFSITPTVYYAKEANQSELSLQPALLLGLWDDIINVGPGFNLTGPDKGKVFLLLSLGYGFKF